MNVFKSLGLIAAFSAVTAFTCTKEDSVVNTESRNQRGLSIPDPKLHYQWIQYLIDDNGKVVIDVSVEELDTLHDRSFNFQLKESSTDSVQLFFKHGKSITNMSDYVKIGTANPNNSCALLANVSDTVTLINHPIQGLDKSVDLGVQMTTSNAVVDKAIINIVQPMKNNFNANDPKQVTEFLKNVASKKFTLTRN